MIASYIDCPETREDAEAIIQSLVNNPPRQGEPIRQSIRHWHQAGCHHFAKAMKDRYEYGQRNMLGAIMVSLANAAIITEHRKALAV